MRRFSNWSIWIFIALIVGLVLLNLNTLWTSAPINLVVSQLEVPFGMVLLGLTAAFVLIFAFASVQHQVGTLLESRSLQKELRRLQGLADKAEDSRVQNLQYQITTEFRLLNERINGLQRANDLPLVKLP